MSKLKNNLRDTLMRNQTPQNPIVELADKIPLRKNEKNTEKVLEKVNEIHQVEEPFVPFSEPPTPEEKPEMVVDAEKTRLVRISLDTPALLHRQLKVKAIQQGLSIRDYLLELINKDLSS